MPLLACYLTFSFFCLSPLFLSPHFSQLTSSPFPSHWPFNTYFFFFFNLGWWFSVPHINTNTHINKIRRGPGAQWWFSCKALLYVLKSSRDTLEEQSWGCIFVFCSATGQWSHPAGTKGEWRRRCSLRTVLWVKGNRFVGILLLPLKKSLPPQPVNPQIQNTMP